MVTSPHSVILAVHPGSTRTVLCGRKGSRLECVQFIPRRHVRYGYYRNVFEMELNLRMPTILINIFVD